MRAWTIAFAVAVGTVAACTQGDVSVEARFVAGRLVVPQTARASSQVPVRFEVVQTNLASRLAIQVEVLAQYEGDGSADLHEVRTDDEGIAELWIPAKAVGTIELSGRVLSPEAELASRSVNVVRAFGEQDFVSTREDFTTGTGPHALAVRDVDDDGNLDVVSADFHGSTFTVSLGDGSGGFFSRRIVPLSSGPRDLALGNVLGDAGLEVISAHPAEGVIQIHRIGDDAVGEPLQSYPAGLYPRAVTVVGFDVAGRDDAGPDAYDNVLVLATNSGELWAYNGGQDELSLAPSIGTESNPLVAPPIAGLAPFAFAAAATLDGGIAGAIVFNSSGLMAAPLEDGTWTAGLPVGGTLPVDVEVADLNGDNLLDVVTVVAGALEGDPTAGPGVAVRLRNQSPEPDVLFDSSQPYPVGTSPSSLAIRDLNADGWPELVVASSAEDRVYVLHGTGDASEPFERLATPVSLETGARPAHVVIADLDGDGTLEILTANAAASSFSVIRMQIIGD